MVFAATFGLAFVHLVYAVVVSRVSKVTLVFVDTALVLTGAAVEDLSASVVCASLETGAVAELL